MARGVAFVSNLEANSAGNVPHRLYRGACQRPNITLRGLHGERIEPENRGLGGGGPGGGRGVEPVYHAALCNVS